jgi:toxin HigB-1
MAQSFAVIATRIGAGDWEMCRATLGGTGDDQRSPARAEQARQRISRRVAVMIVMGRDIKARWAGVKERRAHKTKAHRGGWIENRRLGWRFVPMGGTLAHEAEATMIISFRDTWLRSFFVENVRTKAIPANLEARLFRKLQMLDDATTDADLRTPPSNHFEKLKRALTGWHSILVNEQWRLVFRWHGGRGEASGVYLDNHSYR